MLLTLIFDVAYVKFQCCRHVMLGVVLRGRREEVLMLDVADVEFDVADM
jgi:hypothetical protein